MKPHTAIGTACTALSAICLGLAYIREDRWWILALLAAMIAFGVVLNRWSIFSPVSALLMTYVGAAAVGVLTDLSLPLLVAGSTLALAAWDLRLFFEKVRSNPSTVFTTRLERAHLRSLGMACGSGMLLALLSTAIHLELPFILIQLLALLAVGGVVFGLRHLQKAAREG